MGYYIRGGLVEENKELLEAILKAVEQGKELSLAFPPGELGKHQYNLWKVLRAAGVLTKECGGRYSKLKSLVTVSFREGRLVISPKRTKIELSVLRMDESGALEFISRYPGELAALEFTPSAEFNEEAFAAALREMGWQLHKQSKSADGNTVSYAVEKVEKGGSAWDAIG